MGHKYTKIKSTIMIPVNEIARIERKSSCIKIYLKRPIDGSSHRHMTFPWTEDLAHQLDELAKSHSWLCIDP